MQLHPDLCGNKTWHTEVARAIRTYNTNYTILQQSCDSHHTNYNTDSPRISFPANGHITDFRKEKSECTQKDLELIAFTLNHQQNRGELIFSLMASSIKLLDPQELTLLVPLLLMPGDSPTSYSPLKGTCYDR